MKIIMCVAFFKNSAKTPLTPLVNSGHPGADVYKLVTRLFQLLGSAVGSASAWQTRGRGFEPVLMRYIFSGKCPGAERASSFE